MNSMGFFVLYVVLVSCVVIVYSQEPVNSVQVQFFTDNSCVFPNQGTLNPINHQPAYLTPTVQSTTTPPSGTAVLTVSNTNINIAGFQQYSLSCMLNRDPLYSITIRSNTGATSTVTSRDNNGCATIASSVVTGVNSVRVLCSVPASPTAVLKLYNTAGCEENNLIRTYNAGLDNTCFTTPTLPGFDAGSSISSICGKTAPNTQLQAYAYFYNGLNCAASSGQQLTFGDGLGDGSVCFVLKSNYYTTTTKLWAKVYCISAANTKFNTLIILYSAIISNILLLFHF